MVCDLTLICVGPTAASRRVAFPDDEPLLPCIGEAIRMESERGRWPARAWTSPALAARQSAEALGLQADPDPALAECGYGRWRGRSMAEIAETDPAGLETWMHDPESTSHGGETRAAVGARVAGWLGARLGERGASVAVTHATIMKLAVMHVLMAPAAAFWTVDIEPLARVHLRGDGRRWALRGLTRGMKK